MGRVTFPLKALGKNLCRAWLLVVFCLVAASLCFLHDILCVCPCLTWPSSYKDASQIRVGNDITQIPFPGTNFEGRRLGFQHMNGRT